MTTLTDTLQHAHYPRYALYTYYTTGNGGNATRYAWYTLPFNTEIYNDTTGIVLSGNQFSVPAGKYTVSLSKEFYLTSVQSMSFYNVTDDVYEFQGPTTYVGSTNTFNTRQVHMEGIFSCDSTKVFEARHYCTRTQNTNGLGIDGGTNAFGHLLFTKYH